MFEGSKHFRSPLFPSRSQTLSLSLSLSLLICFLWFWLVPFLTEIAKQTFARDRALLLAGCCVAKMGGRGRVGSGRRATRLASSGRERNPKINRGRNVAGALRDAAGPTTSQRAEQQQACCCGPGRPHSQSEASLSNAIPTNQWLRNHRARPTPTPSPGPKTIPNLQPSLQQ